MDLAWSKLDLRKNNLDLNKSMLIKKKHVFNFEGQKWALKNLFSILFSKFELKPIKSNEDKHFFLFISMKFISMAKLDLRKNKHGEARFLKKISMTSQDFP